MRIDFVNMAVSEGAATLAAIFNNLLGIISRPVAFFSSIFFNRLKTTSRLGVFRYHDQSRYQNKIGPAQTNRKLALKTTESTRRAKKGKKTKKKKRQDFALCVAFGKERDENEMTLFFIMIRP